MNIKKMMKQAADMQREMGRIQEQMAEETVEFAAGGGKVTAVATCAGSLKGIRIDPEVVDPEDVELLEDLIVAAVDGALEAGREKSNAAMQSVTSGMGLPGMGGMPGLG